MYRGCDDEVHLAQISVFSAFCSKFEVADAIWFKCFSFNDLKNEHAWKMLESNLKIKTVEKTANCRLNSSGEYQAHKHDKSNL